MATSGVTEVTLTGADIIKRALRLLGVLSSGESPSTQEDSDALAVLNSIIKHLDEVPSLKRYIKSDALTVSTTISQDYVALDADTMWVESADYNGSPITELTHKEYQNIVDKTTTGTSTHFYVTTDLDTPRMYLYPVPSSSVTIKYWIRRKVEIFNAKTDDADVPDEFHNLIILWLAALLSTEYSVPDATIQLVFQSLQNEMQAIGQEQGRILSKYMPLPPQSEEYGDTR